MELLRNLTDEEFARIEKISTRADLISDNSRRYFVAEDLKDDEDVIFMNNVLRDVIVDFVSFSNFTKANPRNIRIQYRWGPTFTGVGWVTIDELKDGFA